MLILKGFAIYSLGLCVVAMIMALIKGRIDAFVILVPFLVLGVVTYRWLSRKPQSGHDPAN